MEIEFKRKTTVNCQARLQIVINYSEPLMNGLYWEKYYNGDNITDEDAKGYIFYENKLLGVPRIRQLKVKNDSCVVHRDFSDDIKECFSNYDPNLEDKGTFGPIAQQLDVTKDAWNWTESLTGTPSIKSIVIRGTSYPNSGYYQDLKRSSDGTAQVLNELRNGLWIDRGTRAVTIDFTVYNANINLFCVVQLLVEMPATGGVYTTSQFKTVKLLHLKGYYKRFSQISSVFRQLRLLHSWY